METNILEITLYTILITTQAMHVEWEKRERIKDTSHFE